MSHAFPFRLSEAVVLKAVEQYVNHTLFKAPLRLLGMTLAEAKNGYEFTAEPVTGEPHARKPPTKRGLKQPVLKEHEQDGTEQESGRSETP